MTRRGKPLAENPSHDGFFGVMTAAHELKAPTALMRQLALELRAQCVDAHERRLLDQLILTSERSLRLTSNLTKTARLEDAMFELEPVNAQQICEEVAHELTPLYAANERTIIVRTRRTSPLVVANRELLRRVLMSFGDNALHYGASDTPVIFNIDRLADRVYIGLRDKGPILPHRAQRARQTVLTGRPESSGLGLLIADKFAAMMESTIGNRRHRDGMTFFINLHASEQLRLL